MEFSRTVIKITEELGSVVYDPDDWAIDNDRFGVLRHMPTDNTYRVQLRNEIGKQKNYLPQDFGAVLIGVGSSAPNKTELVVQGRQSIAMFLDVIGYGKKTEPIRPKYCRTFNRSGARCEA